MGAPKPGSTFQPTPPQGGKGGGKPMPRPPGGGYPPMQPQVPAQGGKIMPKIQESINYTPPGQVPAQGGKAPLPPGVEGRPMPQVFPAQQPFGPGSAGPGAPPPSYIAYKYAEMERMRAGQPQKPAYPFPQPQVLPPQGGFPQQPGQVPAQGGKGGVDFSPYVSNLPQVQQLAPGQVAPTQAEIDRLRPMLTSPMSPQVLPMKPLPANQAQGLMGLKNILAGKR